MRRRLLVSLMIGVGVFAAVFGAAATLGGITTDDLGADDAVVASCDTDGITTTYTSVFADGGYKVDKVTVGGVNDNCDGQAIQVTLSGASGSLEEVSTTVPTGVATSQTIEFGNSTAVESVTGVHVVISG